MQVRDLSVKLASNIRKFFKLCFARFDRESIAKIYIKGKGIEIGALHNPLQLSESAEIKYVDRMSSPDLRKQYSELGSKELVNVDIIDDGEQLATVKDSTQDFVIANQFLEHCQNPIGAMSNMLRVLKKGGVLYLSIPDKRYSFDVDRPVTSISHLLQDYREGPEWSKKQHFDEWTRYINKIQGKAEIEERIDYLMKQDYSIHYHAWTQTEMLELMVTLKKELHFYFEVEFISKNIDEVIIILRKSS